MAQASSIFAVAVRPFADVILYDPFSYADGSVCTNSGSFWRNQSGVDVECQVRGGALELMGSRTEDVLASLAGGPYARSYGTVLYASFKFSFVTAPKSTPAYFAHFVGGSALRGRIYAGAVDVWPGAFKLYVANGSDTNRALPWNLSTNTIYTAVTRYEVDSALTTLWVNPSAESDPGAAANDPQSAVAN